MEPLHVNGSSGDLRSGPPATNSAEIAQMNLVNKLDPSSSSSTSELPSQVQFQFVTDTNSPSPQSCNQDHLQPQSHHQFSVLQHGNGSTSNSHSGTQPGINLGEAPPHALQNMSAPPSSISSSQNPSEFPSDATRMTPVGANVPENVRDQEPFEPPLNPPSLLAQQENSGIINNNLSTNPAGSNDTLGLHSSLSFSGYESSQVDPFQVMPSRNVQTHPANSTLDETHFSSSSKHLGPSSLLSSSASQSYQNLGSLEIGSHNKTSPFTEQEHKSTASSKLRTDPIAVLGEAGGSNPDINSGSTLSSFSSAAESSSQVPINVSLNEASNSQTDTNVLLKVGLDSQVAAESNDDDIPISSMAKNEQTSDVSGTNSPAVGADRNLELDAKNVSENPPPQVIGSPQDSNPSSEYKIPSHVFARNKSKTPGWSTASNESLFSIHMDNMSFSRELYWGKSGELYSPHAMNMSGPLLPPLTPTSQPQVQQQQQGKSGELYSPRAMNVSSPLIPPTTPITHPPVQQEEKQPPTPQQQSPPPTPPSPINKLNDNSELDDLDDGSRVIEAKAAETMRDFIKEKTENIGKGDLSFADGARGTQNRISHHSHLSDGSTKSFVFPM